MSSAPDGCWCTPVLDPSGVWYIDCGIKSGKRFNKAEAEQFSIAMWAAAQDLPRLQHTADMERAKWEAAQKRVKVGKRSHTKRKLPLTS